MNKMVLYIFAIVFLSVTACIKRKDAAEPPKEDKVVGNYFASPSQSAGWVSGSSSVNKISTRRYRFVPGTAPLPTFEFVFDNLGFVTTLFSNDLVYTIPKQTSGSYLLDSSTGTLFTSGNGVLDFTLSDKTNGRSWRYAAAKQ